jgi:hypothetical protein
MDKNNVHLWRFAPEVHCLVTGIAYWLELEGIWKV